MEKSELRKDRYRLIGMEAELFDELIGLTTGRNALTWFKGTFDPPEMQFEYNGLWFEMPFLLVNH
jgi:hypothetical protein